MENTREWFVNNKKSYLDNLEKKCVNCGKSNDLHLHHIVPLAIGGTNNISNIVILCSECHGKIHGMSWERHSKLTKEGIQKAKKKGKQIGLEKGTKLTTKKSIAAKEQIQKYSKDFNGSLKDTEVMKLIGISRNSYYKYKKEIINEY